MKITTADMHRYARIGAELELESIRQQQERIYAMFPDLRQLIVSPETDTPPEQAQRVSRRGRKMTKAQRAEISRRMLAWHRERRKQRQVA